MKQAKAGTRQHEHAVSDPSMPWTHDTLGSPFEQRTIHLGLDPDGEGEVVATLIRRRCCTTPRRAAVIHVHGWSDYFFQTAMADHFDAMGIAFYALDLRKCGRSHRPGQTRHYASDLSLYDAELQAALDIVRDEQPDTPILMLGHSTGALIQALWLDRLNRRPGGTEAAGITGFIANGPWLDLQGGPWMRTVATWLFAQLARFRPLARVPFPTADGYGVSLHSSAKGQWDFDVRHKPIGAFPITFGWITAIRRGHARVHRGLDIGVPALVLRSDRSVFRDATGLNWTAPTQLSTWGTYPAGLAHLGRQSRLWSRLREPATTPSSQRQSPAAPPTPRSTHGSTRSWAQHPTPAAARTTANLLPTGRSTHRQRGCGHDAGTDASAGDDGHRAGSRTACWTTSVDYRRRAAGLRLGRRPAG